MAELHALAERYLDALYELPEELHVRKAVEDTLAAAMTAGNHACIRGFWRAGKTTLMHGALKAACTRTSGAAMFVDIRDESRDDGLPQSVDWVRTHVTARVQEFLSRVGASELKADPKAPFAVLGELAAPIFVGLDELVALARLDRAQAGALLDSFMDTPKNVKVALVCDRHRELDALFEEKVLSHAGLAIAFVPPVSDEELVHLIQTPALAEGVTFADEALGVLAQATGNRPWELFTLASVVATQLTPGFKGVITPEQVETVLNVDVLADSEEGRALVDNHLRILVAAMTPEERKLVELLAMGGEGEVPEDAVQRLGESGFLNTTDGYELSGDLFAGIARAVAEGSIKVSVE